MNEEKELLEEETEESVESGSLQSTDASNEVNAEETTTEAAETLPAEEEKPKMFTQEEVNSLVGKVRQEARDRTIKELVEKFGVANDIELEDVFGRGQAYDVLNEDYNVQANSLREALMENALLKSGVNSDRWEDVKLILGGKGLDVSEDNIGALIGSHPEWRSVDTMDSNGTIDINDGTIDNINNSNRTLVNNNNRVISNNSTITPQQIENMSKVALHDAPSSKPGVLRKLGNEAKPIVDTESDEQKAAKLFGWKNF